MWLASVCVLAEHNGRAVPDMGTVHAWVTSCCPEDDNGLRRLSAPANLTNSTRNVCQRPKVQHARARVCLNLFEAGLQNAE